MKKLPVILGKLTALQDDLVEYTNENKERLNSKKDEVDKMEKDQKTAETVLANVNKLLGE